MPTPQIIKSSGIHVVYSWTDGVKKMHNEIFNTHEILRIAKTNPDLAFDLAVDKGDDVLAEFIYDKYA